MKTGFVPGQKAPANGMPQSAHAKGVRIFA
jgi:hypothetical protein